MTERVHNVGIYEYVVMFGATGTGFLGGPWWIAGVASLVLTLFTLQEYSGLQARLVRVGGTKLLSGAMLMAALTSTVFATLCFGAGRILSLLFNG